MKTSLWSLFAVMVIAGCVGPGTPAPVTYSLAQIGTLGYTDVRSLSGIRVHQPYASRQNSIKKAIYPRNMPCLANRGTARKLELANRYLQEEGFGLLVWDAWRPPVAQEALWNAVRDPKYVIPPSLFLSKHCYGIAVDVTMVDSLGHPVAMPSTFDEFSEAASSDYKGFDPVVRENLSVLQRAMRRAGFETISDEWWHFEDRSPSAVRLLKAEELGLKI